MRKYIQLYGKCNGQTQRMTTLLRHMSSTKNPISMDIKQRISTMGYLFATEDMAKVDDDHSIAVAIDSTLIKAKGPVWHKSSMKK